MNSEVKTYTYPNGEIQRVQCLRLEDWSQLDFLHLDPDEGALDCFYDIYQNYLVPGCPWIFDQMVLFCLPEDVELEETFSSPDYGEVSDRLTIASIILEQGVKIKGGKPVFKTQKAKTLWKILEERDCIRIARGKLPATKIIPVGKCPGYLSKNQLDAKMKVNANFFIMDRFDCATVFDHVGTPLGLCVKNGVVENPPLFHREALLVKKNGAVSIEELGLEQLEIEINGKSYVHGKNATIYSRPAFSKTPKDDTLKILITGGKVAAVKQGGSIKVPASGVVLSIKNDGGIDESGKSVVSGADVQKLDIGASSVSPGDKVVYQGLEEVLFGIQVGNSIVKEGIKTDGFISQFYNIYHLERVPFPPCLYPMDFEKARAARIALGADKEGKPMLFWAEGAGKLGYTAGEDSTGASLTEMAEIAVDLGMVNAVNLDGGGSAQILVENKRSLRISDRNKSDNSDAERLVPLGLVVR